VATFYIGGAENSYPVPHKRCATHARAGARLAGAGCSLAVARVLI
jgi:hypothetical protein